MEHRIQWILPRWLIGLCDIQGLEWDYVPTTVFQGFQKLKANLEITELQGATVSARQRNVREAVERELNVLESFLTGSYMRSTMIAPLSEADVDIFIVLDPQYYKSDGQAWLLDKVKAALQKTYPKTPEISRNGQAVTITFTDFKVDVVPAFYHQGGGFLIPNSIAERWITTDPKKHVQIWANANAIHKGDLVPLIKMIKGWNKTHSALLRSFHLEALVSQILSGVTISDLPSGVRFVFDKAKAQVLQPIPDPAGYSNNLGAYLDSPQKLVGVLSRLETAYGRAVEAEQLDRQGRVLQAFEKWGLIFGSYFPAYS